MSDISHDWTIDPGPVGAWMQTHVEGFRGPVAVEQVQGGQSNPTYVLTAASGRYVLRRRPPGELLPSAHRVDREHRVLAALAGTDVPVPRVHDYCDDPRVAGTPFFVMDFVEGRIFSDQRLPGLAPEERTGVFDEMNRVLAALHGVNFRRLGLEDFGKPAHYIARQIDRWSRQYRASETETIEAMESLMQWLPAHVPDADEVSVVHGDYRMDNMIFHPTEPRVVALLDWELSTLGHPLSDLAYQVMLWRIDPGLYKGLAGVDFDASGIPTEAQYVARYCERTGRAGIPHWNFYVVYSMFRFAAIAQGIMGRVVAGTAVNPQAEEIGRKARPFAELAWAQVGD